MLQNIRSQLSSYYPWSDRLHYFPSLDSTNKYLKQLGCKGAPHGTAVMAGFQTGGMGRMGRSFHSPKGMGVYLSILLRPDCAPTDLMHLTCAAAVAMCDAVEAAAGFRPGIKWTNDLVYGRKKLGGILTELRLTPRGKLDFAIIGIGINCRQQRSDFPLELQDTAASLSMAAGRDIDPAGVAAAMLESMAQMDAQLLESKAAILDRYRADCVTLGQEISIVRGEEIRHGTALSVDEEGALQVTFTDGSFGTVNSGEVSIRGMYGYV